MKMDLFESMDAAQLRSYIEFLLHHYRVMDAFWFIYVTERFGQQAAEEINERVWGKVAGPAAKDIAARFGIQEQGLKGFVQAKRYFPWAVLIDYQIEEKPDEVVISVPHCPPQEARQKRGLGEYACKAMHCGEFTAFARAIDERICVTCDFAPPDAHPKDLWCRWRFRLKDGPPGSSE